MNLQYRDATLEDLPTIVEIYNSTIPGRMVTADTAPVTVESRINWFREHDPGRYPLWMVIEEGKVVGWMSLQAFYGRPAYNATAEISIYLDETMRGKGIGAEILRHAMNATARLGIKTLLGFIFAHNTPSMKLFMNAGFEKWAHLPRIAKLDDTERDLIIVGKRINP